MITRGLADEMAAIAGRLRRRASRGAFDGRTTHENMQYLQDVRRLHPRTGTQMIFTRDTGHHASGWFRNPEYERCLHLSLSPIGRLLEAHPQARLADGVVLGEHRLEYQRAWARAFFGDELRFAWVESAKSTVGRFHEVLHWRVFCDEAWRPIVPKGEVYSSELTEAGWRSASHVFAEEGIEIVSTVDPT